MKILKTASCLLLAAAALYGCVKDEGALNDGQSVEAVFSAGIGSRASDASWHPNDNIGITMLSNDLMQSVILDGKHNCKYTCPSGTGNFSPYAVGHTIYYPLDGTSVDFVGYYPYKDTDALVDYHKVPVNVASQGYLPNIDLMTFDRYRGASKNAAAVALQFKHRLTKLVFNFTKEDQTTSKSIKKLEILGMKTTGRYDMVNNALEVDAGSQATIEVPVAENPLEHTGTAVALVLPREAASGVTFRITLENDFESQTYQTIYEVAMSDGIKLEEGKAYQFNILLRDKETPTEVSATIIDWKPGGTHAIASQPLTIAQVPGATEGFRNEDQITLYCGQTKLATYEYDSSEDSWTPDSPLYWEYVGNGYSETVALKATYVRAAALNTTQMPEVALASVDTAARFQPLALTFNLQPAKVVFELISDDAVDSREFTTEELDDATIVLPDYITGYEIENGVFTIDDQTIGDVTVAGRRALIVPQKKKGLVAWVTVNQHNRYRVESFSDIEFRAGKTTTITVNVRKNAVTMSATYNDWTDDGTIPLSPIVAGGGITESFEANDKFALYYGEGSPAVKTKIEDYTYMGENVWKPATPVYWEEIENRTEYDFYAVCKLNDAPLSSNQMDDWMYAEHTGATKFGLLDLRFSKQTTRIVVQLTSASPSEGGYSASELVLAKVTFPGYKIGGTYNGIDFVSGGSTGEVKGAQSAGQAKWTALLEPQTIARESIFIKIDMGGGNVYNVKAPVDYDFEIGKTNTFTVTVNKIGITFTTAYTDWTAGYEDDLETDLDK